MNKMVTFRDGVIWVPRPQAPGPKSSSRVAIVARNVSYVDVDQGRTEIWLTCQTVIRTDVSQESVVEALQAVLSKDAPK